MQAAVPSLCAWRIHGTLIGLSKMLCLIGQRGILESSIWVVLDQWPNDAPLFG